MRESTSIVFSVRIEEYLKDELDKLASRKGMSRNSLINHLLRTGVNRTQRSLELQDIIEDAIS